MKQALGCVFELTIKLKGKGWKLTKPSQVLQWFRWGRNVELEMDELFDKSM
jgi:hypothetical protein